MTTQETKKLKLKRSDIEIIELALDLSLRNDGLKSGYSVILHKTIVDQFTQQEKSSVDFDVELNDFDVDCILKALNNVVKLYGEEKGDSAFYLIKIIKSMILEQTPKAEIKPLSKKTKK